MRKRIAMILGVVLTLVMIVSFSAHVAGASSLPKTIILGANTPGSIYYVMSAGFGKVLSSHTPMKVEVFPQGGTVWYPMLESGEVDFGLNVPGDILAAYKGEAIYEKPTGGKGFALRTLMLGSPLRVALLVPGDSSIETLADLKGKRMPVDYGTFYSATLTIKALLANAGYTFDDVKGFSVTTYVEGVRSLMEGRSDASFGSIGSGIVEELNAGRGARYLGLDTSPAGIERMKTVHPGYFPIMTKPGPAGITKAIPAMGKNITLVTSTRLSEDVAYEITKALWENYQELGAFHPMLKLWTKDRFASEVAVVPYHPGAIKLYKEKGAWTDELQAHQEKLLKIK